MKNMTWIISRWSNGSFPSSSNVTIMLQVRFIESTVHEGHSTLDFVISSRYDDYELKVTMRIFDTIVADWTFPRFELSTAKAGLTLREPCTKSSML